MLNLPARAAQYWFVSSGGSDTYDGEQTIILSGEYALSDTDDLAVSYSSGQWVISLASKFDSVKVRTQKLLGIDILHVKDHASASHCWMQVVDTKLNPPQLICERFGTDGDDLTSAVSVDLVGTGPELTVGAAYNDAGDGDTIWVAPGTYSAKLNYAVAESHTYRNLKTQHPLLGGDGSGFYVELKADDDTKTLTFDGIDFYQDGSNFAFWYEDDPSIDCNLTVKNSVITCEYALFSSNAGEPATTSTRTVLFENCTITSTGTVSQIQLRSGTSFTMRNCTVTATNYGANSFVYITGGWRSIIFDGVRGDTPGVCNLSASGYGFRASNSAVTEADQIAIRDCNLGGGNFIYYPDAGSPAWNWLVERCTFKRYEAVGASILVGTDDPDAPDNAYGQFVVRNCFLDAHTTATARHLVLFGAGTHGAVLEDSHIYGTNKTDWCVVLKGGSAIVQRNRIIGPRGVTCASTKNAFVCSNSIVGLPYDSGGGADESWAFSYYSQSEKTTLCNGTIARNNIFLVDATGLDVASGDDLYCLKAGTVESVDDFSGVLDYNIYAIRNAVNSGESVTAYAYMEGNIKTSLQDIQECWLVLNEARMSRYNDAHSIQASKDPLPRVSGVYSTDVWSATLGFSAGSNGMDIGAVQRLGTGTGRIIWGD
jgi:hypothetical protein